MSDFLKDRVNKGVLGLKPYEPGKPIEETEKEIGKDPINTFKSYPVTNPEPWS